MRSSRPDNFEWPMLGEIQLLVSFHEMKESIRDANLADSAAFGRLSHGLNVCDSTRLRYTRWLMGDEETLKTVEAHIEGESDEVSNLAYLPYPASTLSPDITPPDLSDFKSRNITEVQRELSQKLDKIRQEYIQIVDTFNWNKIIYESKFGFEPVIGHTYHLYREGDTFRLSMIEPGKWMGKKFVGSFRLSAGGQWAPEELADGFDLHQFIANGDDGE